jgi:hypothetical protein
MDEGIFGFSKVIVGDSCPGRPVYHVPVTCCTIPSILMRFWPNLDSAVKPYLSKAPAPWREEVMVDQRWE